MGASALSKRGFRSATATLVFVALSTLSVANHAVASSRAPGHGRCRVESRARWIRWNTSVSARGYPAWHWRNSAERGSTADAVGAREPARNRSGCSGCRGPQCHRRERSKRLSHDMAGRQRSACHVKHQFLGRPDRCECGHDSALAGRAISIIASADAEVIIDVLGWYASPAAITDEVGRRSLIPSPGGGFFGITPQRISDSRHTASFQPVSPASSTSIRALTCTGQRSQQSYLT